VTHHKRQLEEESKNLMAIVNDKSSVELVEQLQHQKAETE
jgi:hypothetical protein